MYNTNTCVLQIVEKSNKEKAEREKRGRNNTICKKGKKKRKRC